MHSPLQFQQAGSSSSLFLLPGFVNTAMGTGADQEICQEKALEKHNDSMALAKQWVIMEDMMEDATSSTSSSSSSTSCDGPLYELSELMAQLPIKRGLSKFYQGKSQTFASLESVKSLEDLAKRGKPKRRRMMESSKSYGGGLDKQIIYSPKAAILKKSSRVSLVSSIGRKGTLYLSSFGTSIPVQKSF
ncbi:protein OXIDATIVE STRESS 3-like isoform X2 [Rhododendron vialii]|uniref:protein OXIDATIVE STRESS 3-like isoform X2 n=1 Tax=Rhododendron vialii TaxID=182163 RepID=UPI00265E62F2|nr:protein OXIDATIVE STRESS 3-like isoform X2 [Rhododendron vialii]